MAQRDNLYRRPSGIYVLRITVPVRYRALIGKREIHASTRTTHPTNARAIAARLLEMWYASLEEFRQVDKEKIRGNAPLLTGAAKISLALFCDSLGLGLRLSSSIFWQPMCRCMPLCLTSVAFLLMISARLSVILIRMGSF
ncbi:DUF6538 domain-containing protein [Citrobacter farmeri]|uniref:DUF6538 domain-containing protein n=1 Tax=Citrobacter farmeri TaxID=67824 RepID=UPI0023B0A715|nr:DUF6538 domain-containing protein [Citrobacter farmeri]MEC3931017.1 DUF6538 domain-containing protein [Citrobacter farmeri]